MFTLPASQVKIQTSFRPIPVGIICKYELACRVFSSRQLHIDCAAVRRHADTHHHREFPVTVIPVSPGNAAKISPVGGFSGTAEYTLCAAKTEDLFGRETEPITIRFTVVTEDYRLPTIVFGEDIGQMEIHTGEIVPISIVPGDETKLDRIEIFVDGAIDAVLDTAPYTYSFCYDTPGSVTLTAVGYDASGLSCSIEANITVIKNDPPQLRVEGITDGGIYRPDTITPVKAYAYDRDGIDKILCTKWHRQACNSTFSTRLVMHTRCNHKHIKIIRYICRQLRK